MTLLLCKIYPGDVLINVRYKFMPYLTLDIIWFIFPPQQGYDILVRGAYVFTQANVSLNNNVFISGIPFFWFVVTHGTVVFKIL